MLSTLSHGYKNKGVPLPYYNIQHGLENFKFGKHISIFENKTKMRYLIYVKRKRRISSEVYTNEKNFMSS